MSKKEKKINIKGKMPENNNEETTSQITDEQARNEKLEDSQEQQETDPAEAAQREAEEWKDKYVRLYAEFENYKKRTIKEKSELILNGSEKTITAILPILDDFERALTDKTDEPEAIRKGFDLIFKKFCKTLETLGVKRIETENQDFNVDFHEAIAMVPGMDDDKKGKVIDCVQTGYTLNDKVIRHAKVAVGQ